MALLLVAGAAACGDDDDATAQEGSTTTEAGATTTAPEPEGTEVRFDVALPSPQYGAPVCEGDTCVIGLSRSGTTVSGDLDGVTVAAGAGSSTPAGGLAGVNYQVFIGEVVPCGAGTVGWAEIAIGGADGLAVEWQIIEGTGTGDLAGMSGQGTADATFNADNSGTGTSVGVIDCGA
jgi:hypothetical protein